MDLKKGSIAEGILLVLILDVFALVVIADVIGKLTRMGGILVQLDQYEIPYCL